MIYDPRFIAVFFAMAVLIVIYVLIDTRKRKGEGLITKEKNKTARQNPMQYFIENDYLNNSNLSHLTKKEALMLLESMVKFASKFSSDFIQGQPNEAMLKEKLFIEVKKEMDKKQINLQYEDFKQLFFDYNNYLKTI